MGFGDFAKTVRMSALNSMSEKQAAINKCAEKYG